MTKRNESHYTTFNKQSDPLDWNKKLVGKIKQQIERGVRIEDQ